ncbi:hypothetical protein HK105_203466 [Polyrhizophydium stewartii]|uniref:Ankyrin repeat protein n=1 Tax=Polyrhizophydium stewartii TaxID=2732419 RepID=A0ABR4NBW3_9FUNG|nr:hypothetical protein HK105_001943 [Polyrhizophydium stewartii]
MNADHIGARPQDSTSVHLAEELAGDGSGDDQQRIAEQRQHPPAPPLPVWASHWDRLPAELHDMIIEASGPLTKLAVGAMTHEELEAEDDDYRRQAWLDALETYWQGDLRLLPVVDPPPASLVQHINTHDMYTRIATLRIECVTRDLRYCVVAHDWRDLIDLDDDPDQLAEDAATVGALWLLRELIDERRSVEPSEWLASAAARSGQLSVIEYLHERSPDGSWSQAVATAAIIGGHPDVAEWLFANRSEGSNPEQLYDVIKENHPDSYVIEIVERGWMEVNYLALCEAARSAGTNLMQYLRSKCGDELFNPLLMEIAVNNSVEMFKWLHREFDYTPTPRELEHVVRRNNFASVRWLLETFPHVQWDVRLAYETMLLSRRKYKECIPILRQWAAQHGQTLDD